MRILGIDPGLKITGYGLVASSGRRTPLLEEAGVIRTSTARDFSRRLERIYSGLREIIHAGKPEVMVVEKLYSHYQHHMTAVLMGHARGVIYLAGAREGIPVVEYAATRVKKAISGSGHASKTQIQRTVAALLGLREIPSSSDVSDALALAIAHLFLHGDSDSKR